MGVGLGEDDGMRIIDIEKVPKLYERVVKSFMSRVTESSLTNQLEKTQQWKGRLLVETAGRPTSQDFFVNTKAGQGFCPMEEWITKEFVNGLHEKERVLEFEVRRVRKKHGKAPMVLSRHSDLLARRVVVRTGVMWTPHRDGCGHLHRTTCGHSTGDHVDSLSV